MASNESNWFQNSKQFLSEVRSEFNKVTWPGQKEYVGGTIGVIVVVVIMTVVLGASDAILKQLVRLILP